MVGSGLGDVSPGNACVKSAPRLMVYVVSPGKFGFAGLAARSNIGGGDPVEGNVIVAPAAGLEAPETIQSAAGSQRRRLLRGFMVDPSEMLRPPSTWRKRARPATRRGPRDRRHIVGTKASEIGIKWLLSARRWPSPAHAR